MFQRNNRNTKKAVTKKCGPFPIRKNSKGLNFNNNSLGSKEFNDQTNKVRVGKAVSTVNKFQRTL